MVGTIFGGEKDMICANFYFLKIFCMKKNMHFEDQHCKSKIM